MTDLSDKPAKYLPRYRLLLIILSILCATLFLILAAGVQSGKTFRWDSPVMRSIAQAHTPALNTIFEAITYTASEVVILTLAVSGYFLWRWGRKKELILLVISWVGFSLTVNGLKFVFIRPRPDVFDHLVRQSGYSFPSGHAAAAISLFGLLGIFLWQSDRRGWALFCWVWVIFVAFSRVYLGVHYPSDVLASLSLGVIWLIIIVSNADRITGVFLRRSN